jgi:hypothetical protein
MGVFIVAIGPLVVGFALIVLIARFSPEVARHSQPRADDGLPEITPDELRDVVIELIEKLGLTNVFESQGLGGVLDITLRDPKPLSGGRILLHARPATAAAGLIDAADVLNFAEGVRSEAGTLKGIFIATGGFTEEAMQAARSAPAQIDLIDGPKLLELVRESLPERVELLIKYRGFAERGRLHRRQDVIEEPEET